MGVLDNCISAHNATIPVALIYARVKCGGVRRLSGVGSTPKVGENSSRGGREREGGSWNERQDDWGHSTSRHYLRAEVDSESLPVPSVC